MTMHAYLVVVWAAQVEVVAVVMAVVEAVVAVVAVVVVVVGAALEREARAQVDLCNTATMQGP